MPFNKPYLPIPDQLALLSQRGMVISDQARAADALQRIGYYRLSAYWFPFREPVSNPGDNARLDTFLAGTEMQTIVELYVFDKKLRLLMLDALERIEIALRTDIALLLGQRGPWAHRDHNQFDQSFITPKRQHGRKKKPKAKSHADCLKRLDDLQGKANEDFAVHFRQKYPGEHMPIWMATELWDFGMLSHFLGGMKAADLSVLAARYGLPRWQLLPSWVRSLNFVRNVCAHHGRLWNRGLVDHPAQPKPGELPELSILASDQHARTRLYAAAAVTRFLLRVINPSTSWAERLKAHVATFPTNAHVSFQGSGFPNDWHEQPLWS